jgi:hypothetical protein
MTAPTKHVVEAAERVTRRLADGRIVALAVVLVNDRGQTITTFAGSADGHYWALMAGVGGLLSRLHAEG